MAADLSNSFKSRTIPPPECRVSLTQSVSQVTTSAGIVSRGWRCQIVPPADANGRAFGMENFLKILFPEGICRVNFSR